MTSAFFISRRSILQMAAATAGAGAVTISKTAAAQGGDGSIVLSSGFLDRPSIYFESIRPAQPTNKPTLVLIHGGAHTGSCYLTTPDGRPGWAHVFVRAGYPVIVPDWPGIGRSGYIPSDALTGETVCAGLGNLIASIGRPVVMMVHSMSGPYGWKLLENHGNNIAKVVAIAPGPPGNIQPAPEVVSETAEKIEVRGTTSFVLDRKAPFVSTAGFVRSKLIGKSERFPNELTDLYASGLVPIPPRLIQERLNIGGTQLKVANTANYKGKPVLVVTGSADVDHPREYDEAIAGWVKSAGANVDFWFLPDKGISGNGHMMMLEKNSDDLAKLIGGWIES